MHRLLHERPLPKRGQNSTTDDVCGGGAMGTIGGGEVTTRLYLQHQTVPYATPVLVTPQFTSFKHVFDQSRQRFSQYVKSAQSYKTVLLHTCKYLIITLIFLIAQMSSLPQFLRPTYFLTDSVHATPPPTSGHDC